MYRRFLTHLHTLSFALKSMFSRAIALLSSVRFVHQAQGSCVETNQIEDCQGSCFGGAFSNNEQKMRHEKAQPNTYIYKKEAQSKRIVM